MRLALFFVLLFLTRPSFAQTNADVTPSPQPEVNISRAQATAIELQKTIDQLTQSNRDMLDLLKKQQAVLEDMQFDRRLQSRQIQSLEERLEDALQQNTQLQTKVARLEADAALRAAAPSAPLQTASSAPPNTTSALAVQITPPTADATPAPPSTYLPAPDTEGMPGTKSWHRLFALKGDDSRNTDLFQIQGRTWRVLWHNQDKPGKEYANTSALFINAFPKDDTIPQKVCSKLGSGGDSGELDGPGNYFLKIEASGGSWELAVEDFR
jgi:hypothetical protein